MKIYGLILAIGHPAPRPRLYAVTCAVSLDDAAERFGVRPIRPDVNPEDRPGWSREAVGFCLPLPEKSENPEFVEVRYDARSAAGAGNTCSIPSCLNSFVNMGVWVCELPTI